AVTSAKRTIPATLRAALEERDRTCAVPGCTATRHLEIDHVVGFALGGPTELANTVRLCRPHHAMKTFQGFRLVGGPDGRRWLAPGERASPAARDPSAAYTGSTHRARADE
ncbi:MAG: HNH endonuclease signature motif containing protein, partial [Acidimicrobiales bacterium]